MKTGDHVRVKESLIVYHHPQHRNQAFDLKGMEGQVLAIVKDWQGRPVTANLPVQVRFEQKFRAHFKDEELELIS